MEAEVVRRWCFGSDTRSCDVPAVACDFKDRSLVSEYGSIGSNRIVLCDGDMQVDLILRNCLHGTAGAVAVPESV